MDLLRWIAQTKNFLTENIFDRLYTACKQEALCYNRKKQKNLQTGFKRMQASCVV